MVVDEPGGGHLSLTLSPWGEEITEIASGEGFPLT
jgi:hypothetical protein